MDEAINLVNSFKVEKVIFNCGEFNELEQDLINVLEKLKNSKTYKIDQEGSIVFKIKNKTICAIIMN